MNSDQVRELARRPREQGLGFQRGGARNRLGATSLGNQTVCFRVWAPKAKKVEVWIGDLDAGQAERVEPLDPEGDGHFSATLSHVEVGAQYRFRLDGALDRPDPASRLQSSGVHGPSRIVDLAFDWHDDAWRGMPLQQYVLYELHVGTFTPAGTFAAIAAELPRLKQLGVTAIEIMPVAQFPGDRNWGYDGVYPFAVQSSYGGPKALQRLVDECHRAGIAVVLDVVYNHLGPEGNVLADFGAYFTDRYQTPWGSAMNFDGPESEAVRRFFLENALMWFEDFHVDALRLDAVHAIIDRSAKPFLEELADAVHQRAEQLGRHWYLIAESDLNDPRVVRRSDLGGLGLDAMWCDDYHHAGHVLVSGERAGYYADFGQIEDMARAFAGAMSRPGEHSEFRQRRHGRPAPDLRPEQCVVCLQNHDQVGNRLLGERIDTLVGFEQQKLVAGLTCLSRFIPLLFMGQEYGERAPFQYFVSHEDPELVEAVRRGRREEFASFALGGEAPDPAARATFERCVIDPELRHSGRHAVLHGLYSRLLELRRRLTSETPDECLAFEARRVLAVRRGQDAWMLLSFSDTVQTVTLPILAGEWERLVSSAEVEWEGPGSRLPSRFESKGEGTFAIEPFSFVVYARASRPELD